MTSPSTPARAAVIVATAHDSPTYFLAEAAVRVAEAVQAAGYHPLVFIEDQATLDQVYVGIQEFRTNNPEGTIEFGLFSAHGSERGLHEKPVEGGMPGGELLIDDQMCRQFDNAILVLLACTPTLTFPNQIIALQPHPSRPTVDLPVRAVVGYNKVLQIPPRPFLNEVADTDTYQRLLSIFVAHAELLLSGATVAEAVQAVRAMWRDELMRKPWLDRRLQTVCVNNFNNICSWPVNSRARLC